MSAFPPVTTLKDLDSLDEGELVAGYRSFERDDPEPGANHSRAFWHGWRCAAYDRGQIEVPAHHHELTRQYVARRRTP